MSEQRPLTNFLSWLIEQPDRLAMYQTEEGFQQLVDAQELPEELQDILRHNDLRAAMGVLASETGGENVIFFVILRFVI
jgi:hypothetical protein